MTQADLDAKLAAALDMMRASGFEVKASVEVRVDEKLPFMGYTSNSWNKHVIVVSGFAVQTPMLIGLLIHELSHVYRQTTNHPSHNQRLIGGAARSFMNRHQLTANYQAEILHQVINHLQDLYADDMSFEVFRRNQIETFTPNLMSQFFYDWIRDDFASGSRREEKWRNAALLLSNSFALSNMKRHSVPDIDGKAMRKNQTFLRKLKPAAAERFSFFNNLMVSLPENANEGEYSALLHRYLEEFFVLTTAM